MASMLTGPSGPGTAADATHRGPGLCVGPRRSWRRPGFKHTLGQAQPGGRGSADEGGARGRMGALLGCPRTVRVCTGVPCHAGEVRADEACRLQELRTGPTGDDDPGLARGMGVLPWGRARAEMAHPWMCLLGWGLGEKCPRGPWCITRFGSQPTPGPSLTPALSLHKVLTEHLVYARPWKHGGDSKQTWCLPPEGQVKCRGKGPIRY